VAGRPRYTPEIRECLIATGYLRTAQDFTHESESNIPMNYFEVLQDTLSIFGKSLLGLSLECAQCHSHKYEPVPHEDYFRLMAILTPAFNPRVESWRTLLPFNDKVRDRTLPNVGSEGRKEIAQHNSQVDEQVKKLQEQIAAIRANRKEVLQQEMHTRAGQVAASDEAIDSPDPPELDNLALWLRADHDVFTDDAAQTPAEPGQRVAIWKDQLGHGNRAANDAAQPDAGWRPTLVDDFGPRHARALRFDDFQSNFLRAEDHPSLRPADGLSLFAVYKMNRLVPSDVGLITKFDEGQPPHGNWSIDMFQSPKRPRFYCGTAQGVGFGGHALPEKTFHDTAPHLYAVVYDAGSVAVRIDLQDQSVTNAGYSSPPIPALNDTHSVPLLIGARPSSNRDSPGDAVNFLPGDVAEVLVYERALSGDEVQQVEEYLEAKYGTFATPTEFSDEQVTAALSEDEQAAIAGNEAEMAKLKRREVGKIQAVWDVGPPPPTFLNLRGVYDRPGKVVPAGYLRVLCDPSSSPVIEDAPQDSLSTGRRLALARWLTRPDTSAAGLLARVQVNRVWQHLFGEGLVATPENLGLSGSPPTHPELVEWLAADFIDTGWRVKQLIKTVVTSTVYRQASRIDSASFDMGPRAVDPGNRLLWRQRRRRLESEVIRDTILTVAGNLDTTMFGPPIQTDARTDGTVVINQGSLANPAAAGRRSVYLLARRSYHLNVLNVFDQPIIATTYGKRDTSSVPLQSLTMLNDPFILEQSRAFAQRVIDLAGDGPDARVETCWLLALGRPPSDEELQWSIDFLEQQTEVFGTGEVSAVDAAARTLADVCQTLFNTSEFLYAH